jgi:hypothetical protein
MARQGSRVDRLSPEFLNWASNQAAGDRADGSFFSDLWEGFERYGISTESAAPYQETYNTGYLPTMQAMEEAAEIRSIGLALHWIKRWDPDRGISERQFQHIRMALVSGWPVCGGFLWPKKPVWEQNRLQMCPRDQVRDGHSVMLVGYRDDDAMPGGGVFLIRNSAGPSRDGLLTYAYVNAYMNDAVVIRDH